MLGHEFWPQDPSLGDVDFIRCVRRRPRELRIVWEEFLSFWGDPLAQKKGWLELWAFGWLVTLMFSKKKLSQDWRDLRRVLGTLLCCFVDLENMTLWSYCKYFNTKHNIKFTYIRWTGRQRKKVTCLLMWIFPPPHLFCLPCHIWA